MMQKVCTRVTQRDSLIPRLLRGSRGKELGYEANREIKSVEERGLNCVFFPLCSLTAAAEGCTLSLFSYDKLKSESGRNKAPDVSLLSSNPAHLEKWSRGCVLALAQNFARELMESPANHMTPTMFVEAVSKRMGTMRHNLSHPSSVQLVPR